MSSAQAVVEALSVDGVSPIASQLPNIDGAPEVKPNAAAVTVEAPAKANAVLQATAATVEAPEVTLQGGKFTRFYGGQASITHSK